MRRSGGRRAQWGAGLQAPPGRDAFLPTWEELGWPGGGHRSPAPRRAGACARCRICPSAVDDAWRCNARLLRGCRGCEVALLRAALLRALIREVGVRADKKRWTRAKIPGEMTTPTVFISYSHQDEEWKDLLVRQLKVLQVEGLLEVWEDRKIAAGDGWQSEIEAAIEKARAAVLLISADFLTSGFILSSEVPRLLERQAKGGLRVIPLIVRPCAWRHISWLAKMQCRPIDGRALAQGSAVQIENDLSTFVEEILDLLQAETLPGISRHSNHSSRVNLGVGAHDLKILPTLSELVDKIESLLARMDMMHEAESLSKLRFHLENDRIKVVVLGEIASGKSTFINALLGDDIFPTKNALCVNVNASVRWGLEKKAILQFRDPLPFSLPELHPTVAAHIRNVIDGPVSDLEIPVGMLKLFTKINEPIEREVVTTPYRSIEVYWPLDLSIRKFDITELNIASRQDHHCLLEADVVLLMLSAVHFGSNSELQFINELRSLGFESNFFILNCWDLVPEADRDKIRQFAIGQLRERTSLKEGGIFFVSAQNALKARLEGDLRRSELSGVVSLEQSLGRYIDEEAYRIKLLVPIRRLSDQLRRLEEVAIPEQRQLLENFLSDLSRERGLLVAKLDSAEWEKGQFSRDLRDRKRQFDSYVQIDAEKLLRRLIEEVPHWVNALELGQLRPFTFEYIRQVKWAVEAISDHVYKRIQVGIEQWWEQSLEPLLRDWLIKAGDAEGQYLYHQLQEIQQRYQSPSTVSADFELEVERLMAGGLYVVPTKEFKAVLARSGFTVGNFVSVGRFKAEFKGRIGQCIQEELEKEIDSLVGKIANRAERITLNVMRSMENNFNASLAIFREVVGVAIRDENYRVELIQERQHLLEGMADETSEAKATLRQIIFSIASA